MGDSNAEIQETVRTLLRAIAIETSNPVPSNNSVEGSGTLGRPYASFEILALCYQLQARPCVWALNSFAGLGHYQKLR
jgi:hypothetical protein